MNNKLIAIASFFLGIAIFVVCIGSAFAPVHAKVLPQETNINVPEMIVEGTSVTPKVIKIEEVTVTPRVNVKAVKKLLKVSNKPTTSCYYHELEQQGSPIARFVKVCG